jgi:hypothetical protein
MAEVSKVVSDRIAITRTLTWAIQVHGAEVADALEATLFPNGAPADCNVRTFLAALQTHAQRSADDVSGKDQAHAMELADDAEPRHNREVTRGALREGLIGTRSTLEGVYGSLILTAYGLAGETPTENDELLQAASTTEGLLRNRPLTEKPLRIGIAVDVKAIADDLHGRIEDLRTALGDVRREEREAQVTRDERNTSLIRWNTSYQGTATVVTGLFELAGKSALADRVRPTARRRAGLVEEADTDMDPNTTGNGGTPPTP